MRHYIPMVALSLAAAMPLWAADPEPPAKPRIEVVFVLDTTGSMSGLIESAKAKTKGIEYEAETARH